MASKNPIISDAIERYVTQVITKETPIQKRLREETAKMPMSVMQTTPDQGAFFAFLIAMLGARQIIEVGTFTGYSTLAMASALPADGKLIACDIDQEWTSVGRRYWKEAGVEDRIDLRLAPAMDTLKSLLAEGRAGSFDFAFVDADKTGYDAYYESLLQLLRPGGVVAFDNMLWSGAVADLTKQDGDTQALRALNLKIRNDKRVEACLLTIADGIMLARKR